MIWPLKDVACTRERREGEREGGGRERERHTEKERERERGGGGEGAKRRETGQTCIDLAIEGRCLCIQRSNKLLYEIDLCLLPTTQIHDENNAKS